MPVRSALASFAAVVVLALPPSAIAATASISDAQGDNGASFTQQPTDLAHLDVVWNGNALTVKATYYTIASYKMSLLISDGTSNDPTSDTCDPNSADSMEVAATSQGTATLTMPFISGALQAQAAASDASITYTFSNPALTDAINRGRDPFTCVSGDADGDAFFGGFQGKVLKLTPQNATDALTRVLTQRYGATFTSAPHKWVVCPRQEIIPASDTFAPYALCEFEFGRGGASYRGGGTQVVLVGGALDAASYLRTRGYRKTIRTCRITSTKRGWVNGAYLTGRTLRNSQSLGDARTCSYLIGSAGMAADLEYPVVTSRSPPLRGVVVYEHGTNHAGFEDLTKFPCQVSRSGNRYQFSCRNRLGDRFVYSFTVHRP